MKVENPSNLKEIHFQLTYNCNLKCEMCGQRGKKGYFKKSNKIYKKFKNQGCEISDWLNVIDEVKKYNPRVFLWGGEPLLSPYFSKVCKKLKEEDLEVLLITNGVLLENFSEFIVDQSVDKLYISINGTRKIHNKISGVEVFKKIKNGIKSLKKIKNQKNSKLPVIETNFVILPKNYKNIPKFLNFAEEIGFESVRLSLPWFTNSSKGNKYYEIMNKEFDCDATSWSSWVVEKWDIDFGKLKDIVKNAMNKKYSFDLNLVPLNKIDQIDEWYRRIDETFGIDSCYVPNNMISIFANGDVGFCSDFPDYIIGNIKRQSFEEIWNSKKAKKFRGYLNNKLLPICNRCCSLMSEYNLEKN